MSHMQNTLLAVVVALTFIADAAVAAPGDQVGGGAVAVPNTVGPVAIPNAKPRLILSGDHRFDAMSFLGHPLAETAHMDRQSFLSLAAAARSPPTFPKR